MKKDLIVIAAFIASALLSVGVFIGISNIQAARAVLVFQNEDAVNELEVEMTSLSAALTENGSVVADGSGLLADLKQQSIDPGYTYEETLAARNTGAVSEYVRMIVKKYWTDSDGKRIDLNPGYIELQLNDSDWFEDPYERSSEQSVYYCIAPVAAGGADSADLVTGVRISSDIYNDFIYNELTDTSGDKIYKLDFDYDQITFNLQVELQAVQSENAEAAIPSAWGTQRVTVSENGLMLKEGE